MELGHCRDLIQNFGLGFHPSSCDFLLNEMLSRLRTVRKLAQATHNTILINLLVQSAELLDVIVDGGESVKSLNRPGLQHLLALINAGNVQAVIVAKLDRLTRSVKDLCGLLELFEKRNGIAK